MKLPQQSVALLMAASLVNARIGEHQVTTADTHPSTTAEKDSLRTVKNCAPESADAPPPSCLVAIRPPGRRPLSNTVTSWPEAEINLAAVSPAIPAPITTTRIDGIY